MLNSNFRPQETDRETVMPKNKNYHENFDLISVLAVISFYQITSIQFYS